MLRKRVISFQLSIGIPFLVPELHSVPIHQADLPHATVVPGQLRGRSLSVAATKFVDQLSRNPLWNGSG